MHNIRNGKVSAILVASWNSIVEHKIGNNVANYQGYATDNNLSVTSLSNIKAVDIQRIGSGFHELDRVLGGGLVSGAVMLLAGHPGAGKSTLLLQLVANLASKLKILYVTGEESSQQLAMRAKRLQINPDKIAVLTATDLDAIVQTITTNKPNTSHYRFGAGSITSRYHRRCRWSYPN